MSVSWFICTYKRSSGRIPGRYCAMDDYTAQIVADGGTWSETEVLGNYALVKVRASDTTLQTIADDPLFLRIPLNRLDILLSQLTAQQRQLIRNRLNAMGYTDAEILAALGNNIGQRTLGEVLRFAASRRRKPRYDEVQDLIVLDGEIVVPRLVDDVDQEVIE